MYSNVDTFFSFFLNQIVRLDGIKVEAVPQLEKLVGMHKLRNTLSISWPQKNLILSVFKFCFKVFKELKMSKPVKLSLPTNGHHCTLAVSGKIYLDYGIILIFYYFKLQLKLT